MAETMSSEREARLTLAVLSEPSDIVTGSLVARLGAAETVQLITSGVRLPNGVDPAEGELWRRRLAPRVDPGQLDRIRADMERHDLQLLTPEDVDWPGELQHLGASAPIALWLKGDRTAYLPHSPAASPSSAPAPQPHTAARSPPNSPRNWPTRDG